MFSNPQGPNAGHSDSYAATGPPRGSHRRSSLKSSPDGSPYYTRQPSALPRVGVEDEYSKAPSRKSNASYTQALARMSTKHSMRSCASSMDGGDLKTRQRWKFSYIDPRSRWYKIFWYFVMSLALMSAIIEPFNIAFVDNSGFYPYGSFWSIFIIVSTFFFFLDITLKFFKAYEDEEDNLITDNKLMALKYFKTMFWLDVLFTFPLDGVINQALGGHESLDPDTAMYISLLRWLKIGRLYRIFDFFATLDHSMILSQMSLVLLRNNTYIFFTCHWFACIIYFIARIELNTYHDSWLGRHMERVDGQPAWIKYIYSLYFSVIAFTSVGDGDWYAASPAESIAMILYLTFNLVLNAYILGTITMLVVKDDEKSKTIRDRITTLKAFAKMNKVPDVLVDTMRDHLDLYFQSNDVSDVKVLDIFPVAIKRKVLRHLYLKPVQYCYLMKNAQTKFLDALLSATNVELFNPKVQVIYEGDHVSTLNVIIDGKVQLVSGGFTRNGSKMSKGAMSYKDASVEDEPTNTGKSIMASRRMSIVMSSTAMGSSTAFATGDANLRTTSDAYGEVSFFTESPSEQSAITRSIVRVLTLTKAQYERLIEEFPRMKGLILHNMVTRTSEALLRLTWEAVTSSPAVSEDLRDKVTQAMMMEAGSIFDFSDLGPNAADTVKGLVAPGDQVKLKQHIQLSTTIKDFMAKDSCAQLTTLLSAARQGDTETISHLVMQEISVNLVDYDSRSGLMLAAQHGYEGAIDKLVEAGADPNMVDAMGCSALWEAIDKGQETAFQALMMQGAALCMSPHLETHMITECVRTGNLEKLGKYLQAGASANLQNIDGRSPLHHACRGGPQQMEVVNLLMQFGADASVRDNFGRTPTFEAVDSGHPAVVDVLYAQGAKLNLDPAMECHQLMKTIYNGDNVKLRLLLRAGANPNVKTGGGRTPLHAAARMGNMQGVKELVDYGADVHATDLNGYKPVNDANQVGAIQIASFLETNPSKDENKMNAASGIALDPNNIKQGPVNMSRRMSRRMSMISPHRLGLTVPKMEHSGMLSEENSASFHSSAHRIVPPKRLPSRQAVSVGLDMGAILGDGEEFDEWGTREKATSASRRVTNGRTTNSALKGSSVGTGAPSPRKFRRKSAVSFRDAGQESKDMPMTHMLGVEEHPSMELLSDPEASEYPVFNPDPRAPAPTQSPSPVPAQGASASECRTSSISPDLGLTTELSKLTEGVMSPPDLQPPRLPEPTESQLNQVTPRLPDPVRSQLNQVTPRLNEPARSQSPLMMMMASLKRGPSPVNAVVPEPAKPVNWRESPLYGESPEPTEPTGKRSPSPLGPKLDSMDDGDP